MLKTLALFLACFSALSLCVAQEVEGNGKDAGALFSNANYVELSTPLTNRVGVNTYGLYLGNVRASIPLIEVPIKVQTHFIVTPSYLFISVPPSGLSLLTGQPAASTYRENQFRLAGTVLGTFHHFLISDRNMYVRRFTPFGDVNRYRNKIYVAHSVSFGGYKVNAFAFDEVYHDFLPQKWLRRNWVAAGFDMPLNQHITFQPSYIRHDDSMLRSVNFLGIGVIIKTGKLISQK